MLSVYSLDHYGMSKDEFVAKVCYMDLSPEDIAEIKNRENVPLGKLKEKRRIMCLKERAKELTKMHFDNKDAGMYNLVFPEEQPQPPSKESIQVTGWRLPCFRFKKKETLPEGISLKIPNTKPEAKLIGPKLKAWYIKNCSDRTDFFGLLRIVTDNTRAVAKGVSAARNLLRYPDPSVPSELSKVGGGIWLVTFAFQYCVNPDKCEKKISYFFEIVQNAFLEVVKQARLLIENSVKFYTIIRRTRSNCRRIIEHLAKMYGFPTPTHLSKPKPKDKFIPRPEREHLKIKSQDGLCLQNDCGDAASIKTEGGTNKDEAKPKLQPVDDNFFGIRWTERNVIFRRELDRTWFDFCELSVDDRWYFYKVFMVGQLWLIEDTIGEFHRATELVAEVESIIIEKKEPKTIKTTLTAITGAMLDFIKKEPKAPDNEVELEYWQSLCGDLWYNVDTIYDTTLEIINLAVESFDMIKICYNYCVNFYHWDLPPFKDVFPDDEAHEKLQPRNRCCYCPKKRKCCRCRRKGSLGLDFFLEISEFTNSIYQEIVAKHEVEAEAMGLILE